MVLRVLRVVFKELVGDLRSLLLRSMGSCGKSTTPSLSPCLLRSKAEDGRRVVSVGQPRLTTASHLDTEHGRANLLHALLDQYLEGPTSQLAHSVKDLAKRELPPGTWAGIYLLYQAHCLATGQHPSSRALFYGTIKPWKKVLGFRRRSQHSVCNTCEKIRSEMRHSRCFMDHAKAADRLLGHLSLTWQCRQVYWAARDRSKQVDSDILTLIVDGYDKSKPSVPRWPRGRPPKGGTFDRVQRTGVQVSAIIAHGHGCLIFLADEATGCGGSYTWDTLLIAIDHVWNRCCSRGRAMPRSWLGFLRD